MRAFGGDPVRKAGVLLTLRSHIRAGDVLQKPSVWRDGKGSVVGCILHDTSLVVWEEQLGVPRSIGALLDMVIMNSPSPPASAADFAVTWLQAVPVGADLTLASRAMLECMLVHPEVGLSAETDHPVLSRAIQSLATLLARAMLGDTPHAQEWKSIRQTVVATTDALPPEDPLRHVSNALEEACWDPATSATVLSMTFLSVGTAKRLLALQRDGWTEEENAYSQHLYTEARARASELSTPECTIDPETLIEERDPAHARRRLEQRNVVRDAYDQYFNVVTQTLLTVTRAAPLSAHST